MSKTFRKTVLALLLVCATLMFACFFACGGSTETPEEPSNPSQQPSNDNPSGGENDNPSDAGKTTYTFTFESSGIVYEITGEDSGTKEESIEVEKGGSVDLSKYASKMDGAEFLGWCGDNNANLLGNEVTSITSNRTVKAVFWHEPIKIGTSYFMYFGKYPQDRVTDTALILELDKIEIPAEDLGRLTYQDKTYEKVTAPSSGGKFCDGTEITAYGNYYFELKPLLWHASGNPETEIALWRPSEIIDAAIYSDVDSFDDYSDTDFYEFAHNRFMSNPYFTFDEQDLLETIDGDDNKSVKIDAPTSENYSVKCTDYAAIKGATVYYSEDYKMYKSIYWLHNDKDDVIGGRAKTSKRDGSASTAWKEDCDKVSGFFPYIKLDLRKTYTVTFDTKGGDPIDNLTEKAGESLPTATRNHYTFDGWYSDAEFTQKVEKVPTQDITLYAKWNAIPYDITYDVNTDDITYDVNTEGNPSTYTLDDDVALKEPTDKKDYYTFVGWCKDEELTQVVANVSDIGGGNVTLYAKWVATEYTITYMLDGGTNNEKNPATISYVSKEITLEAPTKESCDFIGWYSDAAFTEENKITTLKAFQKPFYENKNHGAVVGEVTLYAKFEAYVGGTEGDVVYRVKGDEVKISSLADKTKKSAVIPATVGDKTVNAIAESVFEGATALTDITFECGDDAINTLTTAHFAGLTNLDNIVATSTAFAKIIKNLPDKTLNTWTVTEATFGGCDLTNCTVNKIVLTESVTDIKNGAFDKLVGVKELYVGKNATCFNGNVTTSSNSLAVQTLTVPETKFLYNFSYTNNYANVKTFVVLGGPLNHAPQNVEKITLGKDVTASTNSTPYSFFSDTPSLEEIEVEDGNTVFTLADDGSLVQNGNTLLFLKSATIPSNVTEIAAYAVAVNTITKLDIPEGVTSIGEYAFQKNTSIIEVSLPASLTSLGYAFSSNVKTLNVACELDFGSKGTPMNKGVETLNVTAEKVISFSGLNTTWTGIKEANLIGVKTIDEGAFEGCTSLETVNMPALTTGAKNVFIKCKKLKTITLGAGLTEIPEYMFSYSSSDSSYYLTALETINLENVTTIGKYAFRGCTALSVTLGNNVTTIGESAFSGCSITGELNLPASITAIGSNAFGSSNGITAVKFAGTLVQWEKVNNSGFVDHEVDYYCNDEQITSYTPSGNVSSYVFAYNNSLTSVDLSSATEIGYGEFKGCANLETVTWSDNIKIIGDYAFYGCTKFKGNNGVLTLNEGLTHLNAYAFSGCTGITDVTIPESVIHLGNYVFKDCSVEKLWISDSIATTGNYYYVGLQAETITIKVVSDGIKLENKTDLLAKTKTLILTGTPTNGVLEGRGQNLTNIETLILDEGITSIGTNSLSNLYNLKTLVIKADVTKFTCYSYSFQNFPSTLENLYCNDVVFDAITTKVKTNVTNHSAVSAWQGL